MTNYQAVIFDLDGVIVSTDEYHYLAWKHIADQEGIYFDRTINHRMRGVSRMVSLDIMLERAKREYSQTEKLMLSEQKNTYYVNFLENITPADILPGVQTLLNELRKRDIKMAIASSSRNTPLILKQIGLDNFFDAVADGNQIKNTKPDPEVFLLAAKLLDIQPTLCIVVEDAMAGIEAANRAGTKAVAVGNAAAGENVDYGVPSLDRLDIDLFLK